MRLALTAASPTGFGMEARRHSQFLVWTGYVHSGQGISTGLTIPSLHRAKPSVLRDSLVAMDISTFDADKLNTLRLIAPNDDDLSILKSYTDDTAKLDEVRKIEVANANPATSTK